MKSFWESWEKWYLLSDRTKWEWKKSDSIPTANLYLIFVSIIFTSAEFKAAEYRIKGGFLSKEGIHQLIYSVWSTMNPKFRQSIHINMSKDYLYRWGWRISQFEFFLMVIVWIGRNNHKEDHSQVSKSLIYQVEVEFGSLVIFKYFYIWQILTSFLNFST